MLDRSVKLSPDALFQNIAGDGVILDLASASYFGLDGVGVRLWTLLEQDASLRRAFEQILSEYEVSPAQLEVDLLALVDQLVDAKLVLVDSSR